MHKRTTKKQENALFDEIKLDVGLKSRKEAYNYLYNVVARAYKKRDYSLSHYMDGCFTLTKNHMKYHYINHSDLYTPLLTIKKIEGNNHALT